MNVGPCIMTPALDDEILSAIAAVVATAEKVMNPPVNDFPISIISDVYKRQTLPDQSGNLRES